MTRFFATKEARRHLAASLRSPDVRRVTLTGFGGCGKTRLASEIARFFDVIGDALGLPRTTSLEHALHQITERLNSVDRRALLVCDNFEQIVEEGAGEIRTFLNK